MKVDFFLKLSFLFLLVAVSELCSHFVLYSSSLFVTTGLDSDLVVDVCRAVEMALIVALGISASIL